MGVPLGSSTPSTSASNLSSASTSRAAASSCCFSQLQSTSSFAPSHALSAQQQQARSRVPYPTGMTAVSHSQDAALLRHQQQQQQHQMMMQQTLTNTSNHHLPQLQPQQPYIYPSCMNGTSNMQQQQQMGESNALLQMRQSVDELSTNIEKRSRFALRFAPCASDYSNMDANSATRPMHPQQISPMSQPQQLFNPYHQATRQRSTLDKYPMNGQMLPHQQQFTQQYYPSRNVYSNYRYC
ncbi:unnamed protein product [Anisakis simplex]|uniref:Uncharacterized protein n=1 Tax=Anisakis simplex TaxID=6269 RepID=A0A3P6TM12_ANISI|nr:unnamed protein product [Anisakis simplex]